MALEISRRESNGRLLLHLRGRLDIDAAAPLEEELLALDASDVTLDFGECDYVSSAGLRALLTAQKRQAAKGGSLRMKNVPPNIQDVFEVTGLGGLFDWSPKLRELSLANATLISKGAFGDCYRLDAETVLKLYRDGIDPSVAEREKQFAKAAFVLGVPTAISYDVVTCGDRTGIVYEMLDAELFSAIIRNNLDDLPRHARLLSGIAKTIHATRGDPRVFPDIRKNFRSYIEQMGSFLDPDDIALLLRRLDAIPPADTCVHFDIHSSNIMLKEGEPFIIDMGDFSIGSYLLDIGLLATIYATPEFDVCELATGISQEKGLELFDLVIGDYFADRPAGDLAFFMKNRHFLASLRAIYTITTLPSLRERLSLAMKHRLMPKIRLEG
jgi:uncharacterized protein (TIGR02172 family)